MTTPTEQIHLLNALSGGLASGELKLSSEAIGQAIACCDAYINAMARLRRTFVNTDENHGFGNLPSGQAIGRHFADKRLEMATVLGEYIEVAERIKETFVAARQRYAETHSAHVAALGSG
ncbi:hypothetical protein [Hoyosella subflava]|uniref:PE domain-containing protein n=1 Tax=Hoyosella subflava (strain DSM 45089 / JCM 17490 / NBRC 109087 / DQS3-9A1) TaxID=443218 RepID=F6EJ20_HOYSD|nr:hypothetical protein [Hoyosella subflava]AEF41252.1 hypothetical protein AS9A_2805 [Hoyosella subflava DQS3-9A1]